MAVKDQSENILEFPGMQEKKDYSQRDTTAFFEYVKEHLVKYERNIEHLYLDTAGEVTVGIGHLIKYVQDIVPLDFVYITPPPPPLPDKPGEAEKRKEWTRVKKLLPEIQKKMLQKKEGFPSAKNPVFSNTNFKMEDKAIADLFEKDLLTRLSEIRVIFKRFDKFPDPARLGIIDLYYNVGSGTFREFVLFKESVLNEDWRRAGKESIGKRPNPERLTRVKQLFEEAYEIKAKLDGGSDEIILPGNRQNVLTAEKGYNDIWQA